eukprot:5798677-Ditylum_brightwellii.AAC.1
MTNKFEEKFTKLLKDQGSSAKGKSKNAIEPALEGKRSFAQIITKLDKKYPAALIKNLAADELEINVDHISPGIYHEAMAYVEHCGMQYLLAEKAAPALSLELNVFNVPHRTKMTTC